MKPTLLIIFFSLLLLSCSDKSNKANKQEIRILSSLNETGLVIKKPQIAPVGEEVCVDIYLTNPDFMLLQAYLSCDYNEIQSFDPNNKTIDGCSKKLFMEGDTVRICLTKNEEGILDFEKIYLLLSDSETYYLADTTFFLKFSPLRT